MKILKLLAALISTSLISACGGLPSLGKDEYVKPISDSRVVNTMTPQSERLTCLGKYIAEKKLLPAFPTSNGKPPLNPVRFAVGRIDDLTGKQDLTNGKRLTQGAALMAISAFSLTQLPLVERYDTAIAEIELKYTDNKLIGDSQTNAFRNTYAGSVPGSDFHFMGGITEANYNIRSGEIEGSFRYLGSSARYVVIDVAMDTRLINTRTLEVVSANTFRKQILGTEFRTGYFRFLNNNLIDLSASERSQEPVQQAIRMVVEHSIYKSLLDLYRVPSSICDPVIIDENSRLKLSAEFNIPQGN
ncbi:MAG: transcriptional regulator [Burkholderiales bacterium]|nr:transcriptional regulator [Burkholderiales bacterium]